MAVGLRQLVLAPKSDITLGRWHSGKVPKADFPMAKQAYGLGNSFRWSVIAFKTLGLECRALVVFNLGKQKFEAILGVMGGAVLRILCSYEYHASEPGWHCHATCDDVPKVPIGYMRGQWVNRRPAAKKTHRRQNFMIDSETTALRFAMKCYKIEPRGPLL